MISADPSSIPGLSEETRKILEEKARRAGKPFDVWLNEMLAADLAAHGGAREAKATEGESWTQERVARLRERIEGLSSRGESRGENSEGQPRPRTERVDPPLTTSASDSSGGGRRATGGDAPTLAMIAEALKGLEAEAGRIAAREPIRPRTPVLDPEPLTRRSTAADNSALRAAVAEIAARQEVIERARSTPAREAALIERVSELKGEVGNLAARLPEADLGKKVATLTETMREGLAAESRGLAMLKEQLTQLGRAVDAEHQGRKGEGEAIKKEIARIARLIEEDGAGGRTALATLVERLDEQRAAFQGLARESTLQSLEDGYRHVIGRLDELARAMPANDELKSLSSAVAHIGERLAQRSDKSESARIEVGFAELRAAITKGKSSEKIEAALATLGAQIDKALAGLPSGELVESLLDRLEVAMERLDAADPAPAGSEIAGLKQALADFRSIADRLDAGAGQAPIISALDDRLEEMARGLTHAFLEAQARSQNKLEAEIKALAARLDAPRHGPGLAELREHLEDMTEGLALAFNEAQAGAVQRLEEQIRSLTARLEAQPDGTPGLDELRARLDAVNESLALSMAEAQTGAYQTLEGQIRALTERLGTQPSENPGVSLIRERLDALSAELKQALAAQSGSDLRIESEMRALTQRVEAGRAEATAVAQLGERLEALAESLREAFGRARDEGNEKLETEIRALAARIDNAEAEAQTVAQLEAEFRVLAARLEEPRTVDGPTASELDLQIRALRARVEASEATTPAIGQLEARIQGLAERLERLGQGTADAPGLATADSEESAALIEALTQDLHTIRAAAENADQRASENLDSVQAALDGVVGRLSALEGAQRPRPTASELGAERASLSAAFGHEEGQADEASGANDAEEHPETTATRKADFIAAARRAAQAAAAESAAMRLKDAANKPGRNPLSRIAGIFKNRGRPLMLAAAAVVLTVGAVRLYPQIAAHGDAEGTEIAVADATGLIAPPAADRDAEAAPVVVAETAVASAPPAVEMAVAGLAESPRPSGSGSSLPAIDPSALAFAALELGAQAVAALPPVITQGFEPASLDREPVPDRVPSSAPAVAAAPAPAAAPARPTPAIPVTPGVDNTITTAALPPAAAGTPAESAAPGADSSMSGMNRLMAAANAGDPFAQFELADRFSDGRGVAVDLAQAASWYEKAANGGIAVAQYRIGSLYERGQGVPADREAAKNWYEKAAAEGNVQAMHNLAVLVAEGVGGGADIATATEWFERAAEGGVSDSQFNLGVIYARGLGRAQDLVQSYKWFALAANAGDGEAADRREVVAGMMTPDQLAQARAAVLAWRATPPLPTANTAPVPDPAWAISAESTDLVRQVQALLGERGFNAGPADGIIGTRTRDAVREYQRAAGLPVTGTIDSGLLASLSGRTI